MCDSVLWGNRPPLVTPSEVGGWQRQAEPAELADGLGAHIGTIGKLTLAAATHRKSQMPNISTYLAKSRLYGYDESGGWDVLVLTRSNAMKRIISVSRRTDVPAFYGDWFMRRVREGYAGAVNPFGGNRYLVPLKPEDVSCFVFWSKDFTAFVEPLETLDRLGYRFYFNYTLTALPAVFESHVDKDAALKMLLYLSERYSPGHINWRFDPIVLSDITDEAFYLDAFERLASRLAGRVERCYFSFVTLYSKVKRNFQQMQERAGVHVIDRHLEEKIALAGRLASIAERYGIRMYSCCGEYLLSPLIQKAHCIDGAIIQQLFPPDGCRYKDKPTRKECGCTESVDIGTYDTCPHGCVYCYANANKAVATRVFDSHDPDSAFLGYGKAQSDAWVAELRQETPA